MVPALIFIFIVVLFKVGGFAILYTLSVCLLLGINVALFSKTFENSPLITDGDYGSGNVNANEVRIIMTKKEIAVKERLRKKRAMKFKRARSMENKRNKEEALNENER